MAKKESRTKRQHFVPRFYLSQFASDGNKVWTYDKFSGKVFDASVWGLAQERGFYDYPAGTKDAQDPKRPFDLQQIEKALATNETAFAGHMRNLVNTVESSGLSTHEIDMLAAHVAIQWMRTKEYRENVFALAQQSGQALVNQLTKLNYPDIPKNRYPRFVIDRDSIPGIHNEHFFTEEAVYQVADMLERYHLWVVGVVPKGQHLYTSDNPVVRRANQRDDVGPLLGLRDPGVELAFPISPRYVLRILERKFFAQLRKYDGKCMELQPHDVADLNRLQVIKSYRQVYCLSKEFELARNICKEKPDICNPDRPRSQVDIIEMDQSKFLCVARILE